MATRCNSSNVWLTITTLVLYLLGSLTHLFTIFRERVIYFDWFSSAQQHHLVLDVVEDFKTTIAVKEKWAQLLLNYYRQRHASETFSGIPYEWILSMQIWIIVETPTRHRTNILWVAYRIHILTQELRIHYHTLQVQHSLMFCELWCPNKWWIQIIEECYQYFISHIIMYISY